MTSRTIVGAAWPWVWRLLLGLAILAAPVITFRAFTDDETPDPQRRQRLQEVRESNQRIQNPPVGSSSVPPGDPLPYSP